MLFTQIEYFIFFVSFFFIYFLAPKQYLRSLILLCFSYYFYAYWNVYYLFLIIFATAVSFLSARLMHKISNTKLVLTVGIVLNLSVLLIFKYYDFFISNINYISQENSFSYLNLLLPVGISFYTFQSMAYLFDVYNGKIKPERNYLVYSNFISFFPQLVAGPIERANNLLPQLKNKTSISLKNLRIGIHWIVWGLFKKLVIADNISPIVTSVYSSPEEHGWFTLICATYLFAFQIYCDFSGYCDIAIGSARSIGIKLSTNFRNPYIAKSIREFWERWHITLSHWFRDYVYRPLIKSFKDKNNTETKAYRYLVLTFILSGFWHGAAWTFLAWGLLHGFYRLVEIYLGETFWNPKTRFRQLLNMLIIFNLVCLAWIFFRSESLTDALTIYKSIFTLQGSLENDWVFLKKLMGDSFLLIISSLFALNLGDYLISKKELVNTYWKSTSFFHYIYLISLSLIIVIFGAKGASPFIYFQF